MAKKPFQSDFYEELDKNKHKVSFSCTSLLVFLLILFLAGAFLVWWGIKQIKTIIVKPEIPISEQILSQAEDKLTSLFKKDTPSGEIVTLTLTDEELTALLVKNELLASEGKYSLKNPTAVILDSGVSLAARLVKPIEANITALAVPRVEEGKLKLDVHEVSAGKLPIPKLVRSGAESLLSRLVVDRLNDKGIYYQSVTTVNHILTLSGRKQ